MKKYLLLIILFYFQNGLTQIQSDMFDFKTSKVEADLICTLSSDLNRDALGIKFPINTEENAKAWILGEAASNSDLDILTGYAINGINLEVTKFNLKKDICDKCFNIQIAAGDSYLDANYKDQKLVFTIKKNDSKNLKDSLSNLDDNSDLPDSGVMNCKIILK